MTGRSAQTPVSGPPAAAKEWPRLWEIDALRGLAVVAMVIYHAMWDLMFTGLYAGDVTSGGWRLFARTTATTFFLLVGVSMTLLTARHPQGVPYRRWAQRGLKLLAWGMVISLITWPLFGRQFIAYGVLHFIGTALLLAPLLLRWRTWAVPLAVVLIGIGLVLVEYRFDTLWLLPLGVRPAHYLSVDYFPLLPWLGVILLGVWLGPLYLEARTHRFPLPRETPLWARPAVFLGRHSLIIYLLHQPLIIAVLLLLGVRFF